ncbi:MAG TPA: hypothetical protein VJY62_13845, partial [Bacteroidia bacterium]|nr:hypothetical protein [Bacteroidia bacterium]
MFFLNIPSVRPDENWGIVRMRGLINDHYMHDSSLPKEVSPWFHAMFNATPLNQLVFILPTGVKALIQIIKGGNENHTLRIASFLFSLCLLCSTYILSRNFNLSKPASLLAVIVLIITPDFFNQLHVNRPEILLTAGFIFLIMMLKISLEQKEGVKKNIMLYSTMLISWIPSIIIHPSGMIIPPVLGAIYLCFNYKSIFSLKSVITFLFFIPGFILYLYVYLSIPKCAALLGGGNYFNVQGPPILTKKLNYFLALPLV